MRFLADMGVSLDVVRWLRDHGHDAKHLRDEKLHRLPNGQIFKKAIAEDRVLITFDLDFGEIVALSGGKPVSVILFRLHNTRTDHVLSRLDKVMNESATALDEKAIVIVEDGRHRTRRLPI